MLMCNHLGETRDVNLMVLPLERCMRLMAFNMLKAVYNTPTAKIVITVYSMLLFVHILTHSLTAALDLLGVVASSTSNDPGPRSRQHQQIGQCPLPIAAANFSVDDPAGASSQQREECRCGLLLTVEVPAKQVCSPVGDRCVQIMNDVCQQ